MGTAVVEAVTITKMSNSIAYCFLFCFFSKHASSLIKCRFCFHIGFFFTPAQYYVQFHSNQIFSLDPEEENSLGACIFTLHASSKHPPLFTLDNFVEFYCSIFSQAGEKPNTQPKAKANAKSGLLTSATDWQLEVDLSNQLKFPARITPI